MQEFIALLLAISLLSGVPAALNTDKNVEEVINEPEQIMEEVRNSSEKIIMSEENVTTATQLLASLPEPEVKPSLAIYKIQDKTGQYDMKGSPVVTQGATEMLITALKRSRQYTVLDRVDFSDFMNEQNLVTNNRTMGDEPVAGRMIGADYVISGAVTEYQIDKKTGGIGLKIAGKGGSEEYAEASCAIDIRVTDTTTGEVVWSKSLKGKIKGKKVNFQVFSFMGENIVEFETGQGKQEVINLVVRTLLEEAVYKLYESDVLIP